MAIVRVQGKINGGYELPSYKEGDVYYFRAPGTLDGQYICEFWAEDDYGNIGYASAILTVDHGRIIGIELLDTDIVTMLGDPMRVTVEPDAIEIFEEKSTHLGQMSDEHELHTTTRVIAVTMLDGIDVRMEPLSPDLEPMESEYVRLKAVSRIDLVPLPENTVVMEEEY